MVDSVIGAYQGSEREMDFLHLPSKSLVNTISLPNSWCLQPILVLLTAILSIYFWSWTLPRIEIMSLHFKLIRDTIWIDLKRNDLNREHALFYDIFAKVLYFRLIFSLTVLHHKTAALRSPMIYLSCFFLFISSFYVHRQNIYILNNCGTV